MKRKPRDAAATYEIVLAHLPTHADAHAGAIRSYEAARAWDDLVSALDRRARSTDDVGMRAVLHVRAAQVHERERGDRAAAAETYARAHAAEPRSKRILSELIRLSEASADVVSAIRWRDKLAAATS